MFYVSAKRRGNISEIQLIYKDYVSDVRQCVKSYKAFYTKQQLAVQTLNTRTTTHKINIKLYIQHNYNIEIIRKTFSTN